MHWHRLEANSTESHIGATLPAPWDDLPRMSLAMMRSSIEDGAMIVQIVNPALRPSKETIQNYVNATRFATCCTFPRQHDPCGLRTSHAH